MKLKDLLSVISALVEIRVYDKYAHNIGSDRINMMLAFGNKEVIDVWTEGRTLIINIDFETLTVEKWIDHMNARVNFEGDKLVITPLGDEPITFSGIDQICDIVNMAREDGIEWEKEEQEC